MSTEEQKNKALQDEIFRYKIIRPSEIELRSLALQLSHRPPEYPKLAKQAPVTTLELWRWLPLTLTTIDSFLDRDRTASAEPLNSTDNQKGSLALTKTDQYTARAQLGFCNVSDLYFTDTVDLVLRAFKHVTTENIDLEATKKRLGISRGEINYYRRKWFFSEQFVVAKVLKQRIIQEGVNAWYQSQPELVGKLLSRLIFDLELHREHDCLEYRSVEDALHIITDKDDLYEDCFKPHFLNLVKNYEQGNEQSVMFAFYYLADRGEEDLIEIVKEADKLGEAHRYRLQVELAIQRLQEAYPERFYEQEYVEDRKAMKILRQEGFYISEDDLVKALLGEG